MTTRSGIETLEPRRLMSTVPLIAPPQVNVPSPQVVSAKHGLLSDLRISNAPGTTYSLLNAPAGMNVNASTGQVIWVPTIHQVGNYSVTEVGTNAAGTAKETFVVKVYPDSPEPYYYPTDPDQNYALAGVPVQMQVGDGSQTPGVFSVASAPAGLTINPTTGQINWTPTEAETGPTNIVIRGTNIYGQTYLNIQFPTYISLGVTNIQATQSPNSVPTLSWTAPVGTNDAQIKGYKISLQGYTAAGITTYSYDTKNSATEVKLTGLPKGFYDFIPTVKSYDAAGHVGIATVGDPFVYAPPALVVDVSPATGYVNQPLPLVIYAGNTNLPTTYTLISGPKGMASDFSWTPTKSESGNQTIKFSAANLDGTTIVTTSVLIYSTNNPPSTTVTHATSTGFDVAWTPPTINPDLVAGYHIYVNYEPGDDVPDLSVSYTVPATARTFHFSADVLGSFGVSIAAVDAQGNEGG